MLKPCEVCRKRQVSAWAAISLWHILIKLRSVICFLRICLKCTAGLRTSHCRPLTLQPLTGQMSTSSWSYLSRLPSSLLFQSFLTESLLSSMGTNHWHSPKRPMRPVSVKTEGQCNAEEIPPEACERNFWRLAQHVRSCATRNSTGHSAHSRLQTAQRAEFKLQQSCKFSFLNPFLWSSEI